MRRLLFVSGHVLAMVFIMLSFAAARGQAESLIVTSNSWRVVDGDTIHLDQHKIRLLGIDAPEIKQHCETSTGDAWPCGQMARDILDGILESYGKGVACVITGQDRYKRDLGRCYAGAVTGGIDVQRMLIRSGFAVSEYSKDYQQDEAVAAKQARGMWAGSFQRPKDWRKAQRGG